MLKDDRMMGMLTFVVIMLAVGTMIQRAEFFQRLFGTGDAAPVLAADEAMVQATQTVAVDVLANDSGIGPDDAGRLTIVAEPECGRAFVREGRMMYLGSQGCIGEQTVRYGLGSAEATAEVRIVVRPASLGGTSTRAQASGAASEATAPQPAEPAPSSEEAAESQAAAGESVLPERSGTPTQGPDTSEAEAAVGLARMEPRAETGGAEQAPARPAPSRPAEVSGDAAPARPRPGEQARAALPSPDGSAGATTPDSGGATADPDCTVPATVTLELAPAAMTRVSVDAPCYAGEVAELAYEGLRFALPLDAQGAGSLAVPGFRGASEATLDLAGREVREFTIPFSEIERIDRVAVVWEAPGAPGAPAALALHAFEFGARPGTPGHVSPAEPRSFETVRRTGGGWLAAYEPAHGKGRRIEVYSFWRRFGASSGVVRLGLDPAAGAGDCAGAAAGTADYRVLRMTGGRLERPRLGRIAPLDCTVLAGGAGPEGARDAGRNSGRFIDAAVDDLVVRRR